MRRPEIVQRIAEAIKRVAPDAKTILYGSEARGDARPDSDIDLLILLKNEEGITLDERMRLIEPLYDIELESNITKKIIKYVSNITLDIYLGSSLIDNIIYPIFNSKITSILGQDQILIYMPMMFAIVFILSTIYGSIRKLIINVR